jgi:hypothetical protein
MLVAWRTDGHDMSIGESRLDAIVALPLLERVGARGG